MQNNKNLEIANLVFNWLKCLGEMLHIEYSTISNNQEEVPFSLEYFQSKFTEENLTDLPEDADSHTHIYIDTTSGLIQLIDDEAWHNYDYDFDMSFSLDLPDIYFTAHIY